MSELYDILKQGLEDAINHNVTEWVQVRHGHWIAWTDDSNAYECSICGETWQFTEGNPKDNNANYCPQCGAKMDEEETEDEGI